MPLLLTPQLLCVYGNVPAAARNRKMTKSACRRQSTQTYSLMREHDAPVKMQQVIALNQVSLFVHCCVASPLIKMHVLVLKN